jgi:NAD(P)-dependent dehydrogenase (short-subunit alcohol dehydrogenase family)
VTAELQLAADGSRFVVFAGQARPAVQILPRPAAADRAGPDATLSVALLNPEDAPRQSRGPNALKSEPLTLTGRCSCSAGHAAAGGLARDDVGRRRTKAMTDPDLPRPSGPIRLCHRGRVRHRRGADRGLPAPGGEGRLLPAVGRDRLLRRDGTGATGNRPLFLPCDISVTDQLQLTLSTAAKAHGPITVLVNNAANDQRHETLKTDQAFWDWSISVNLRSYFFACQSVIPGMQAAGGGSIINFSSISFMMADKRLCRLHHRQCRDRRHDPDAGARVRAGPHPGERGGPRLGADRAAEGALGHARGPCCPSGRQCLPEPIQPEDVRDGPVPRLGCVEDDDLAAWSWRGVHSS